MALNSITIARDSLQAAVGEARFELVQALAADYVQMVADQARRTDPGDPAFDRLRQEAVEVLENTRQRAIAEREHAAARLRESKAARTYQPAQTPAHINDTEA